MQQRTFSILKPDLVRSGHSDEVSERLQQAGLRTVAQKRLHLTDEQAKVFYAEHAERPFFAELTEFMTSGPCIVQVLSGEDAVVRNRTLMGATDPAEAEAGTIRADFGTDVCHNAVHGSDAPQSAEREIAVFFTESEIASG